MREIALYISTVDGCEPIIRDGGPGSMFAVSGWRFDTAALTRAISSESSNGFAR